MSYRVRFYPIMPVLMVLIGTVITVALVAGPFLMDDFQAVMILGYLFWLCVLPWLLGSGVARTRRAIVSRGVAFAIERKGVRLGARPGAPPQFFPWVDVDAIVRFEVPRTVSPRGLVHVGVSLREDAPGGIAEHERRLAEARGWPGLTDEEREMLGHMVGRLAGDDFPRGYAVSGYLRARDWYFNRTGLPKALRERAAGVEFVHLADGEVPHEWLDDRDRLAEFAADREKADRERAAG